MPRTKLIALLGLIAATTTAPVGAQQGSPNTTPGPVTRITLVRINPGHGDMFWEDVRKNIRVINEENKRRGNIADYSVATKVTTEDPNDWNVAFTVSYKNWSALDDLGARTDPVTLAHYGSVANRTAANNARIQHGTIVASFLVRNQTVNPWK